MKGFWPWVNGKKAHVSLLQETNLCVWGRFYDPVFICSCQSADAMHLMKKKHTCVFIYVFKKAGDENKNPNKKLSRECMAHD